MAETKVRENAIDKVARFAERLRGKLFSGAAQGELVGHRFQHVIVNGNNVQIGKEELAIDRIRELYIRHDKPGSPSSNVCVEIVAKKPESQRTPHGLGNVRVVVGSSAESDHEVIEIEEKFRELHIPILHY